MQEVKIVIGFVISSIVAMFAPIGDMMIAMLLLFIINGGVGLLEDIINGDGWKKKKAMAFGMQCAVYFGTIMSLFVIGRLIHKHIEAVTCVNTISIVTIWVFGTNILRNARDCCTIDSSMYKLFDILYYVVSVQVVERLPIVQSYIAARRAENSKRKGGNV